MVRACSSIVRAAAAAAAAAVLLVPAAHAAPILPQPDPCLAFQTCVQFQVSPEAGADGSGTITSSPAGIDCRVVDGKIDSSSTCASLFRSFAAGIDLTLTAMPTGDSQSLCAKPLGSGARSDAVCTGHTILDGVCYAGNSCSSGAAFAFFVKRFMLTVTKTGVGSGTVTSQPAGIDCGGTCEQADVAYGSKVTLTAAADKGAVFQTWTGACNGQGASCTLTLTQDASTNAVFGLPAAQPQKPQQPQQPQKPQKPQKPQATLAATIVFAVAVRHARTSLVEVRIRISEPARARLLLLRHGVVKLQRVATLASGGNTIRARIPASLPTGFYRLALAVRDAAGRSKTYSSLVLVHR